MTAQEGHDLPYDRLSQGVPMGRALVVVGLVTVLSVSGAFSHLTDWIESVLPKRGLPPFGAQTPMAVKLGVVGLLVPFALVAVRGVERRPVGTIWSVRGRVRWSWLGLCALLAVAPMLWVEGSYAMWGARHHGDLSVYLASVALLVVLVIAQATGEQMVVGLLMQAAGSMPVRRWAVIGTQAVAFAAWQGGGLSAWTLGMLVYAAILGWLTIRTGGLEAAIALRVVYGALVALGAMATPLYASAWHLPILLGSTGVYAAFVAWTARNRDVEDRSRFAAGAG